MPPTSTGPGRKRGDDAARRLLGHAVRSRGDAARERLSDRQEVGLEIVRAGVAAGPGAQGVRLVDHEERPVPACELSDGLVVARLREDDPDVRKRGLEEAARDVAFGQLALEAVEVVDLDDPRRQARVDGRPDVVRPRCDAAVGDHREGLVDRAVVAPVVHEHLRPAGRRAREPDREPIGVGRGERELPARKPEAPRHLLTDPDRVLGREHQRRSAAHLLGHGHGRRLGRMARHRARVTQAEIDVLVPVDVAEPRPGGLLDEDGERAGPLGHPVHRDSGEKRAPRAAEQLQGTGVALLEAPLLAGIELGEAGSVDGRDGHRQLRRTGWRETDPVYPA